MEKTKLKTVSLVLGSGGARGLAHIGVIKWLLGNKYEIKSIAGCSIGSLIGGVYAAGKLDRLEEWMCALTKTDILSLIDLGCQKAKVYLL
jgi:NTE family protein